ncbi:DNA-directed RNA polymerase subunit alpha [Caballeronia choica]|jgi:DNA-directed RNA polymerase alpha subunit|uniref:DNA-directed RNA polymerase subunit alpha n=1 Tax=Caballeronia choica TaxID=326476 RepID=A0A158KKT6_9BURK|nr:DNA-directed RNA polymerase subunit alpha C-terminal domain-containing protein [Caballeronia choica]SAL81747.1 DNA-directed RNA polymerase subunit alpha [Caballeronia choica]
MAYSVPTNPDVPYTASLDGKFVRSYVSRRTANALSRSNVRTITQLCALPRSTLQAMPGLGDVGMSELDSLLSSLGLTLAGEKPEPRARLRVRPRSAGRRAHAALSKG